MSWNALASARPDLAAFGVERFRQFGVAYLATIRQDGALRLHPVTPIVGHRRLFVFVEPTSPKGHDLLRDGRCALHCAVGDSCGGSGEFHVAGSARLSHFHSWRSWRSFWLIAFPAAANDASPQTTQRSQRRRAAAGR